ncbi:hypothetical protein OBBRIDRAFT_377955 [Obba rivulosa]|uniref:F-box domain-containing protein n=1 Tax=Obba rivulosa TaxID=1052685 RepID=A0A8E2DEF2_9APHY|nr:hypothetical protein OBBRIDRAFT_377955 [Obba rivulosa]
MSCLAVSATLDAGERFETNPRGLPREILCQILGEIDEVQALVRCSQTCKSLAFWVRWVMRRCVSEFQRKLLFPSDMWRLRCYVLTRDDLIGSLLREVSIPAGLLVKFVYEFAGILPALRILDIQGGKSPMLYPLQTKFFCASSQFKNLAKPSLCDVRFWAFVDLTRFVCAFIGLTQLDLIRVSWRGTRGSSLKEEPFARSLKLQGIAIVGDDISKCKDLLSAPNLLRSVSNVTLIEQVQDPHQPYVPPVTIRFTQNCTRALLVQNTGSVPVLLAPSPIHVHRTPPSLVPSPRFRTPQPPMPVLPTSSQPHPHPLPTSLRVLEIQRPPPSFEKHAVRLPFHEPVPDLPGPARTADVYIIGVVCRGDVWLRVASPYSMAFSIRRELLVWTK